jgi:hypothetical protein
VVIIIIASFFQEKALEEDTNMDDEIMGGGLSFASPAFPLSLFHSVKGITLN